MNIASVLSKNGVKIRLTKERWIHIITSHLELSEKDYLQVMRVISNPEIILKGDTGELLAVKKKPRSKMYFVVPYKEVSEDGFVLTAYMTTDLNWLLKKEVLWIK